MGGSCSEAVVSLKRELRGVGRRQAGRVGAWGRQAGSLGRVYGAVIQFSSGRLAMSAKCQVLRVKRVRPCASAVLPMRISKSSISRPLRRKTAFWSAQISSAGAMSNTCSAKTPLLAGAGVPAKPGRCWPHQTITPQCHLMAAGQLLAAGRANRCAQS